MTDDEEPKAARSAKRGYRKRIEESMAQAEVVRKRLLMKKRIDLARQGVTQYQNNNVVEAVVSFKTYIKILESVKGVSDGGLQPSHFDKRIDIAELLLISGVYWDLMKIYDKTATAAKTDEFRSYTEKFIIFSRGMPFQAVCAETLRKYISNKKANHKTDFKNAYKMLGKSSCFVATALYDVSEPETIEVLRAFRDLKLQKSFWGRIFIHIYYRLGPTLARGTDHFPEFLRKKLGQSLNFLARRI